MTDLEYHYKFVDIFNHLRDRHAEYHIPGTHACIKLFTGIEFSVLQDYTVVVSHIEPNALSPDLNSIKLGDRLMQVDSYRYSFVQADWMSSEIVLSVRDGLETFSRINGKNKKLPTNNEMIFGFQPIDGEPYSVSLPWIADIDERCVQQVKSVEEVIGAQDQVAGTTTIRRNNTDFDENPRPQKITNSMKPKVFFNRTPIPISNPSVEWAIFEPERSNLGVITLNTFGENKRESNFIVLAIRALLRQQLANTSAVVFDVRSNPAGSLGSAANLIPQLVSEHTIETSGGTVKVHPYNQQILAATPDLEAWALAYSHAGPNDYYAPEVKFTEERAANMLGQVYEKPVGVFTSSKCSGACELFVATMDLNGVAFVFGENGCTGQTPTQAVDYNSFLRHRLSNGLDLPYAAQMPLAAPNFKISWQMFGQSWGYIRGSRSEYVVKPSIDDILNPGVWSSQFRDIANELLEDRPVTQTRWDHPISTTLPEEIFANDDPECSVCLEMLKDTIISPCGHFCLCSACCEKLGTCPMCRSDIACVVPANLMTSTTTSHAVEPSST